MTDFVGMSNLVDFSAREQDLYKQMQEMDTMFKSPAFQRILAFMEELEKAALQDMADNHSEAAAWPLQQRWNMAKQQRQLLLRYIDSIRSDKRELLESVLRESGIPDSAIAVVGAMLDSNKVPIMSKPEAFR